MPVNRWIWLCLAFACADDDVMATAVLCSVDADCGPGGRCEAGVCGPRGTGALATYEVELRPPVRSSLSAVLETTVWLPPTGPLEWVLPTPVTREVAVTSAAGEPLSADLSFRPAGGGLDVAARATADRSVSVRLLPGEYEVRISPLDPALPPVQVRSFVVEPGPATLAARFSLPARFRQLTGVVRPRVSMSGRIAGARIEAAGIGTGLSGASVESGRDGSYALALPQSTDARFLVRATLPETAQPAWRYEQIIEVPLGEDRERVIELDVPSEAVRGFVDLDLIGLGPDGPEAVAEAKVTLTASVGTRLHEVSGRTDAAGRAARLPVLKGEYRVQVEPPIFSPFSRFDGPLDLRTAGNHVTVPAQLTLSPRVQVTGRVTDEDGQPVAFAAVTADAIRDGGRSPEVETEGDGRFVLQLGPGRYLLRVEPRDGPGLTTVLEVPETDALELELSLGGGQWVEGTVAADDGSPVEGATVLVFARTEGIRHRVAHATTDPSGRFELWLPN